MAEQQEDPKHALYDLDIVAVAGVDRAANKRQFLVVKRADAEGGEQVADKTKTEDGVEYPAAAYAYVPDPDEPSGWKIRLWDKTKKETAAQIGDAVAALGKGFRGKKAEIPAADLPGVKAKVKAAWKRVNPDAKQEDVPEIFKARQSLLEFLKKFLGAAADNDDTGHARSFSDVAGDKEKDQVVWQALSSLQEALDSILDDDDVKDKKGAAEKALTEFRDHLDSNGIFKIGRRMNAEKLGNLKDVHQSIGHLINWAEAQDNDQSGNDDTGDQDGAGADGDNGTANGSEAGDGEGPGASGDAESANNDLDLGGQVSTDKRGKRPTTAGKEGVNVEKNQEDIFKGEIAALKKSNEDMAKANATIMAQLTAQAELNKSEKDLRIKNECVAKAAGFKYLATPTAELGEMLYKAQQSMSAEDYAKLEATFKAANEAAKNAGVFKVIGSDAATKGGGAVEKAEALAKETVSKSGGKLNHAAAMAEIFKNDPELYAEYDAEQKAGGMDDRDDGVNE